MHGCAKQWQCTSVCVHDSAQTWACTLGCVDGRAKGGLNGCAHICMRVSVQGEGCTRVLELGFKLAHSCEEAKRGSGVQVNVGMGLHVCLRVHGCVKGAVAQMCMCARIGFRVCMRA